MNRNRISERFQAVLPSLIVGFALMLQHVFHDEMLHRPFLFLYPAVLVACLIGNLKGNLVAVLLALLGSWYWFFPVYNSFQILSQFDYFSLVSFGVSGIVLCVLSHYIKRVQSKAEELSSQKNQQEKLKEQSQMFDTILSTTSDFHFIFDRDHRFIYANEALLRVYGLSLDQLIGKKIEDLGVEPDLVELHRGQLNEVLTGKTVHGENAYTNPAGVEGFFEYTFTPVFGHGGRVQAIVGHGQDTSLLRQEEKRKREDERQKILLTEAAQREKKLALLSDVMPQIVYITDAKGRIKFLNQRWFSYIGKTPEEYDHDRLQDLIHPEDLPHIIEVQKTVIETKSPYSYELRIRGADGQYRWFIARGQPVIENGEIVEWYGTSTDIHDQKMGVEIMRNQSEWLQHVLNKVQAGIILLDPQTRKITFMNESVRTMTAGQVQQDETKYSSDFSFVTESGELLPKHLWPRDRIARGDALTGETYIWKTPAGVLYFQFYSSMIPGQNGYPDLALLCMLDVTKENRARKSLERADEEIKFIMANSNTGTWTVSLQGESKVLFSPEASRIFGYESTYENVNLAIAEFIHPDDREHAREVFERTVTTDSIYNDEYRIIRADGEVRWIHSRGRARYDENGKPAVLAGLSMDITDRKLAEVSMKLLKEEAERANQLKSAFLANMSHEIRTPLGAILGFTDLLREPQLSEDERNNYLNIVKRNGEQLSGLINDILDLSKIEAGHLSLDFTSADPKAVAIDVISLLQVKAKEKNLRLDYESEGSTPAYVTTDHSRLRQILLNIVGNAIKFTDAGSIHVRSYFQKTDDGEFLSYEVSDTGIGIPENQKERVFEVFVQADGALTRKFGGTGLGLALSRELARSLGGDVVIASSQEGHGSTFRMTVRNQPELAQARSAPVGPERRNPSLTAQALAGMRVLVVDDAPDNQQLISHILTRYGAQVEFADNGLAGFKKALAGQYAAVIMDIQMPEMDGYTATQKLREAGFRKPIIALTAHAMDEVRTKCLNVGCNDHLTKPIKPKELVETLHRYHRDP